MAISEKKMKIVINNYFKTECDIDTSIREAFEKGFRIGVEKGQSMKLEPRKRGKWIYYDEYAEAVTHICSECGKHMITAIGVKASYCWNCGADMTGGKEE